MGALDKYFVEDDDYIDDDIEESTTVATVDSNIVQDNGMIDNPNNFPAIIETEHVHGTVQNATAPRVNPDNIHKLKGLKPKTVPFDHQVVAYNRFHDKAYFALFADMGTGKSKITIDIGAYKYNNGEIDAMMIIAPNNVHIQWKREQFPIHCPIPYEPYVWEQAKWQNTRYKMKCSDFMFKPSKVLKVFFVNVESFQGDTGQQIIRYFCQKNRVFCVLDESTRIKTPEAKRSIAVRELWEDTVARCILTGTPTAKSPLDIWSPFNFLEKNYFSMSWPVFRNRFTVMINDYASRRKRMANDYEMNRVKDAIAHWQGTGDMFDCLIDVAEQLGMSVRDVRHIHQSEGEVSKYKDEALLQELIGKDTFSIKKEDCLDLPEKVYEIIYVDMAKDQKKAYEELKAYMMAMNEDGAELEVMGVLALYTRFMQICGGFFPSKKFDDPTTILYPFKKNPKLLVLMDDIEENCHDKQAIIWGGFTSEVDLIKQSLIDAGYTAETFQGKDDKNKREKTIEKFKNGSIQFLVAKTTVAGHGFNFQHCHIQYFYSNNFRTEARLQAEDRTHRSGQTETCVYKDILVQNSIDSYILDRIKEGKVLNDIFKSIDDVLDAV